MHAAPSLAAGAKSFEAPDCFFYFAVILMLVSRSGKKEKNPKLFNNNNNNNNNNKGIRRINWNLEFVSPQRPSSHGGYASASLRSPLSGGRFRHRPLFVVVVFVIILVERERKKKIENLRFRFTLASPAAARSLSLRSLFSLLFLFEAKELKKDLPDSAAPERPPERGCPPLRSPR